MFGDWGLGRSYSSINSRLTNDNKSNSKEPEKKNLNNDEKNEYQIKLNSENIETHYKNKVKSYDKTKKYKKIEKKDGKKNDHIIHMKKRKYWI